MNKYQKYVLLFLFSLSAFAFSAPPITLEQEQEMFSLGLHLDILEDKEAKWTIEEVSSDPYKEQWFVSPWETPNFGFTPSAYWARVQIINSTSQRQERFLEFSDSMMYSVGLYQKNSEGKFEKKETGRKFPFSQRDINYSNFVFILSFEPGESKTLYLRVESKLFLNIPLTLWSPDKFWTHAKDQRMFFGFILGIIFIMAFYNLFIYFSVRDSSYLYYVAYTVCVGIHIAGQHGFSYEYLWPDSPFWAIRSAGVFLGLTLISMVAFTQDFLKTKEHTPRLHRFLQVLQAFALVGVLVTLVFIKDHGLFPIVAISICVSVILAGILCVWQGYRPAKYFLWAWSLLLFSGLLFATQVLGLLPRNFWTLNSVFFGSIVQFTLLSLALGDKIKVMQEEKLAMMKTFEKFVPKQFLNRIAIEGFNNIELGKAKTEWITILFSDIRSFTDLSETMTPQELMNFLNDYLTRMNRPIHESHGFIDKFIGDAIMGLFDRPNHSAGDGARAAIKMLEAVQLYNRIRAESGYAPIGMGIGVHTGEAIIGTVGSEDRMDSTVLGDTVNLASRLEGLTKYYNTQIVISSKTREMLNDDSILCRKLDLVAVKGKTKPESIFEIFNGDPPETQEKKLKILDNYKQALEYYYATQWEESIKLLDECLKIYPGDIVCQNYVDRCKGYQKNPPPENWDGVLRMTKK